MANNNKKYHYIYKTTCQVTGKYYIGIHSTSDLNDGYIGSGVLLKHSVKKYGVENHVNEILAFADNRKILSEIEKTIVTGDILKDSKCLNLKEGGDGGYMSSKESRTLAKSKKRKNRYRIKNHKSKNKSKSNKIKKKTSRKNKRKRK